MLVLFTYSSAQVPQMINYQGKLTKASGAPLDTTVQMIFSIYADSNGTILKWTETQGAVKIDKGVFNVLLGDVNPIPDTVFDGNIRYLGVKVGGDPEITPRKPMVSVPYAYRAGTGGGVDNDWTINGDTIYHLTGSVGIGTTSPWSKLHIQEAADGTLHNTITLYDLRPVGNTVPGEGPGIYLSVCNAPGSGAGQSNAAIYGVRGANNASTDFAVYAGTTSGQLERLRILGTNGNVGIGTTSPNDQLEITGNLRLPSTTSTAGIIKVGADRFIHSYGEGNTFIGKNAGNLTMTGNYNTANGYGALYSNTTGNTNTVNGYYALYSNTTGWGNTANGYYALYLNTTGYYNTANGRSALYYNSTGNWNTANGQGALYLNTTGSYNTADGFFALYHNTDSFNTANGYYALYSNTTGSYNTALGYYADVSSGNLTNATAIGANAVVAASNSLVLGGTGAYAVKVGIGTTIPQGALDVTSTTGALIVPRMTSAQRDALTAVNGMIIYNTSTNQFNFYENGAWVTK